MSSIKRLKGRDHIQSVYKEGKSSFAFPIKVIWMEKAEVIVQPSVSVSVWVAKRNIRKAVDRNKIKRRIKAALQKNEMMFLTGSAISYDVICIYAGKEILDFNTIEKAVNKLARRLK